MPRRKKCRRFAHNVLLLGPQGAYKSMLGYRLTPMFPAMILAKAIDHTRIPASPAAPDPTCPGHDPPVSRAPPIHLGCGSCLAASLCRCRATGRKRPSYNLLEADAKADRPSLHRPTARRPGLPISILPGVYGNSSAGRPSHVDSRNMVHTHGENPRIGPLPSCEAAELSPSGRTACMLLLLNAAGRQQLSRAHAGPHRVIS